jgi:hypothetical protein
MKDHLCERTPLGIFSWKDLLWVYHIEMIDLIWERAPMGYPYHIEMIDHLCERAPLGICYRDERSSL